ncbi:winged helix domain-containing protein [Halovulum sp. GXIMD14794]
MQRKKSTRNLGHQDPGRSTCQRAAASALGIADAKRKNHSRSSSYAIQNGDESAFLVRVKGRMNWALGELIAAGEDGCTPLNRPAPRWSEYVRQLRLLGIEIETVWEEHGGAYPGRHGRYVLRSIVRRVSA